MEIFAANKQWSTRPEDERFTSLESLYAATKAYADAAREAVDVPLSTLKADVIDGDVRLVGRKGVPAKLTHWAFGQLASKVGAPASYLRGLPASLAAENLNHGLIAKVRETSDQALANLLFHTGADGHMLMRSITSDRYERIWNYEVAERLLGMQSRGWTVATPDIRIQDNRLPLYASDHDMFAFIMSQNTILEADNPQGLKRGLIVMNSEVGASALVLMRFLYREMCGNHIIWGAENVTELKLRHVGNIRERMSMWDSEITAYLNSSASKDEAQIAASKRKVIAATKEDVLDAIFGLKVPGLSRTTIGEGYDAVVPDQDGKPNTVWGLVQGITRYSQTVKHADTRTQIDRAAGRLLQATF
jgi:hypothetical protein